MIKKRARVADLAKANGFWQPANFYVNIAASKI
jgi:hypothetical protein